ncbi:type II toxin-antitoxin system VapC family toxin [soil metagenome]
MEDALHELGLADTSVFIAQELGRPLSGEPPARVAVSVVTIAELRLGVLAAPDVESRAQRLETLSRAETLEPLPVDRDVAGAWARLRLALRDAGRRMPLNDSWIAATALAHRIPVVSQDGDYDGVPLIELVRV